MEELQIQKIQIPAHHLPAYCISEALERGLGGRWLINVFGGLGDVVCAEPTVRYMLKHFAGEFSICTRNPELFSHLKFKEVFDRTKDKPDWDKYFSFHTMKHENDLISWFVSYPLMSPVDYASICSARMILPNKDKEIQLPEFDTSNETVLKICMDSDKYVVIHAGKTWTSRTFPKLWWDATISEIQSAGFKVVLIGHSINQKLGFVNVMTEDCIDLRNRLSLTDLVFLLKNCSYLLTNDSSPIHIAASSSKPYIAFISTVKHPDFLMHWRAGKYGYKMQNLGLDGVWNHLDFCPIRDDEHPLDLDVLPKSCPIEKILPDPGDVASHFSKLAEGLGMK